jgi:hypothetical protein
MKLIASSDIRNSASTGVDSIIDSPDLLFSDHGANPIRDIDIYAYIMSI